MSVPRTTAGIQAHLVARGCVYDYGQFQQYRLSRPIQSITNDCACVLTLTGDGGLIGQFHVGVTLTHRCMQVLLPWLTEDQDVSIDHILGSSLSHDALMSQVIRSIYVRWDGKVYPGLRELLDRDGYEVGPYRIGAEYRPLTDILNPDRASDVLPRVTLTVLRVISLESGSKRAAVDSLVRLYGLTHSQANQQVSDLIARRPEYFRLQPGRAYVLTHRGYEVLSALENRIGDDVPWPC